jgi:hypothetical protein
MNYLIIDRQLTKEEAIALFESREWSTWTNEQRCGFQLFQECLCMPFDIFQKSVEKTLGRPVFTHEFASEGIKSEYLGMKYAPTFSEIADLIPAGKRIIVNLGDQA